MDALKSLPFQRAPYSARNWGHDLHWLCSYPSRLKPAIASFLISHFTAPGDLVADPFCGIGTIPLEAALQGRGSLAGDLSPLAAIVTSAKLQPASAFEVDELLQELESQILASIPPDLADEEIAEFYHPDTLREVLIARRVLEQARRDGHPAANLVTSVVLHILHGNRPYALSRRSHNIIPIPPKGPFEYRPLVRHVREKLARHRDPLPARFVRGAVHEVTAEALAELSAHSKADAVITSPPFLGSTEFVRQNRIRLWFCGWGYERQREERPDFYEHQKDKGVALTAIAVIVARLLVPGGVAVLHLGVVRSFDMAQGLADVLPSSLTHIATVYEDARRLESHGRTDRGGTASHAYIVLLKT